MSIIGTVAVQGCTGMTVGAKLNIVPTRELHLRETGPRQMEAFSKISLGNKKSGRINAKICYLGNKVIKSCALNICCIAIYVP